MSDLVYDLPDSFLNDEKAVFVLDANASFYQPRKETDGFVLVEKCLVRKGQFVETPLTDNNGNLVASSSRTDAFLVDETNFTDIGGGLQTFERHYATFPTTWYQYEEVSYQTAYYGVINNKDRVTGTGAWSKTRSVLAKATHYYLRKNDIPTQRVPDEVNAGIEYVNDFTKYYNIAPRAIVTNWENYTAPLDPPVVVAITPDRIKPYMGRIYEFIRYTIEF